MPSAPQNLTCITGAQKIKADLPNRAIALLLWAGCRAIATAAQYPPSKLPVLLMYWQLDDGGEFGSFERRISQHTSTLARAQAWRWNSRTVSMSMTDSPRRNHYELLQVSQTASPAEIKASYHRLFSHHPDKSDASKKNPTRMDIDIGSFKEAFTTLFSPESRIRYDCKLSSSRSRPVHIVSLGDFEDLGQA